MKEQVDAILDGLKTGLATGTTSESVGQSMAELQALSPISETDRFHLLSGFAMLNDILATHAGPEEAKTFLANRDQLLTLLKRLYGSPETPYVRSRAVVERVALALRSADAPVDELVTQALAEISGLAFDEQDSGARVTATLCVHALHSERNWRGVDDDSRDEADPRVVILRRLRSTLAERGFDREAVLEAATALTRTPGAAGEPTANRAAVLMIVLGMGLQSAPDALPALEPVRDLVVEAMAAMNAAPAPPPPPDFAARCEAELAELERGLREEGYSEYLLRQCSAGLQELEPQTKEDARALRAALVRMIDTCVPHARPEVAQTLLVTREAIVRQEAPPEPPADAATLEVEGRAVLERLREALAAGASPSPEVTRAITAMQALAGRVAADDEAAGLVLLELMPQIAAIAAPYAPAGLEETAQDTATYLSDLMGRAKAVVTAEDAEAVVEQQAALREVERFGETPTSDPWEGIDAKPHQRQFAALLRPFFGRLRALRSATADERDAEEIERLCASADVAFQRLRAATTEAQWIDQQRRKSLRRVAVSLREVERRHHLMLVEPPWPSPPVSVDANAVFFGGSPELEGVVEAAAHRIGMAAAVAHGVDQTARGRWDRLRRSVVAVFDFTSYDRVASDPADVPRSSGEQDAVLRAAAPIARVAYEYGWAMVLGTPVVPIVREGRALPFDIDIEPVRLRGDPDDVARVVEHVQGTLYGTQRGALGSDLSDTVEELRARFGDAPEIAELMAPLQGTSDATLVRLTAAAILDKVDARHLMLALPALPPAYPPRDGARTLFHVTAFRDWARPCQDVVRAACSDDIEYRIGYEDLRPDILRAVWNDLCRASFVVADLTNLNPNAVLELGIAHALGRRTLVVSRSPDVPRHLPALANVRVHTYSTTPDGLGELARLVERFLASHRTGT